jgi:hypothetical protein
VRVHDVHRRAGRSPSRITCGPRLVPARGRDRSPPASNRTSFPGDIRTNGSASTSHRSSANSVDECIRSDYTHTVGDPLLDPEQLDDYDPFEIDTQAAHLFKHPHLGIDEVFDVWVSDPLFYPANPPAHWLMCAEVAGDVLVVPIAPSRTGDPRKCRPIGCYVASQHLADQYRKDR